MVRGTITMSSSYATGGDSITAAQIGLGQIKKLEPESPPGYVFSWNSASGTIQAYWTGAGFSAVMAEVTATQNLSAVVADFVAWG